MTKNEYVNGVNVTRFARILVKRWRRTPQLRAQYLPELNALSGWKEALYPKAQQEVCEAIERLARQKPAPLQKTA